MAKPGKRVTIRLEPRQQLLLGVTGGLVLLVWLVRFLYIPVWGRIADWRSRLQELTVKIADASVLTAELAQQERALAGAEARHRALEERVGEGQSVARILDALGAQAKAARLELVAVQPRPEELEARTVSVGPTLRLREVPLKLQLTGRYRQIGEFLGGLAAAPFVSSVRSLKMTKPDAESTSLKADIVLVVYLAEEAPT